MAFGGHVGSFWRSFGVQNGPQKPLKTGPKKEPKIYNFVDQFWTNFGVHSGAKNCSRRGPKLGPLLEPRPYASQRFRACVFTNYTRGLERLLELEIYSPKEREGSTFGFLVSPAPPGFRGGEILERRNLIRSDRASFWLPLGSFGLILVPVDCSWPLLVPPSSSWLLLAPSGSSWLLVAPPASSWPFVAPPGSFWPLVAPLGSCWPLLVSPGSS